MLKLIVTIIFLNLSIAGQQSFPDEVLEHVRSRFLQMNDYSASFVQAVKMRYKPAAQQQSGTLKMKKGNKYRIETEHQTIVTDGVTVWMYTPKAKQVLIDKVKSVGMVLTPDKFFRELPKGFTAVSADQSGPNILLTLQPVKKNASFAHIVSLKVLVRQEDWSVTSLEYIDKNGTTTTITITNALFNSGINDAEFQFEVTKEMHVVQIKPVQ